MNAEIRQRQGIPSLNFRAPNFIGAVAPFLDHVYYFSLELEPEARAFLPTFRSAEPKSFFSNFTDDLFISFSPQACHRTGQDARSSEQSQSMG